MADLTHLDKNGQPAMVDIGGKAATRRTARAEATVWLPPEVMALFDGNDIKSPKGAVFQTAILAGIMAAKKTAELIPLCHPLPLDDCKITYDMEKDANSENGGFVHLFCTVKTDHRTGVEMEALTGVSMAALTLYDMCKALSHEIVFQVRLVEKTGGKSDFQLGPGPKL
jgi:cyclic pyranopterin phosphate synthase